ncbi:exosortase/archaeosortase family protein [Edaphobacter aggregans]|uniref:exosortase/archaeosortase family protein n=1 Tax=Edaphobacter aggregans TaxID=570835 RepID=UPI001FE19F38|nr:exosortase/archaeosortase family protein [Edaphobacter aggregans]
MKYNAIQTVARSMQSEPASPEFLSGQEQPLSSLDRPSISRVASIPFLIIGALLIALYYRIAIKLVIDWYNIADYSHGFLVPLFSLFLLWDKRKQIAATPARPTWAGLGLVVFGLITLIFGVYGVDLFTSRISFVFLLAGLVWTFFGGQILRQVIFPILVLLLAIPFPAIIFNQITFPLQLLASQLASMILPLLGVPVLQEGNVIQLPVMKLEVAEACSGIRSLMSLFTLAVFYGYFLERTTTRRVILALASIPIAVAANVARIVGTGLCVQYWDPVKALGFFHEFSGWVMFVISLLCLYLIHRLMQLVAPAKEKAL